MRGKMNWRKLPDRRWIQEHYLPQLEGEILYVGVERYTDFYHELCPHGTLHTIDIKPENACYGSPGRHHVGDVLEHAGEYEHVACYGLLGFCIFDRFTDYHRTLDGFVKPGGTLMLGHHNGPKTTAASWLELIAQDFPDYDVIEAAPPGISSNLIWWGRKHARP